MSGTHDDNTYKNGNKFDKYGPSTTRGRKYL